MYEFLIKHQQKSYTRDTKGFKVTRQIKIKGKTAFQFFNLN